MNRSWSVRTRRIFETVHSFPLESARAARPPQLHGAKRLIAGASEAMAVRSDDARASRVGEREQRLRRDGLAEEPEHGQVHNTRSGAVRATRRLRSRGFRVLGAPQRIRTSDLRLRRASHSAVSRTRTAFVVSVSRSCPAATCPGAGHAVSQLSARSSVTTMTTGAPPVEIDAACASASFPPGDAAHR